MNQQGRAATFTQVSRRDFLAVGGAGIVGLSLTPSLAALAGKNMAVIQVVLNGGASHLETFDPKPHASREIRGPLHSIATRIPSVRFAECLPRLADRADKLVVVRSLCHAAAPIHETGSQFLASGSLINRTVVPIPIGQRVQQQLQGNRRVPVAVEIRKTPCSPLVSFPGASLPSPAEVRTLGQTLPEFHQAPVRTRESYGSSEMGERFWTAARLVEGGSRYILLNTFDKLEGERTWDAHGDEVTGPANLFDYRDTLGPQFDQAFAALIDDLQATGLWKQTLVLCTGEMGRTPRMNERTGRDHWTQAWSGLLAGGVFEGGQVIGETDEHGEEILNHPVPLSQFAAITQQALGLSAPEATPLG